MILIFKTNVASQNDVHIVSPVLSDAVSQGRWTFDLEDCDHVLRVEAPVLKATDIINSMRQLGYDCSELI